MTAGADRWIRWITIGCVGLLALIAGTVSYLHMHRLVARHGQPGWVAALTPFSVDGMVVAASTTLLADSRTGRRGGLLPWTLLVGETRRRQAVDKVAVMQFDRHGNRTWQQAKALLDSEHVHRAVGEVAVPCGVCAEPSNVKAGGQACPFRFRCAGCDHLSTDVSYLPDPQSYLNDLLRCKERLLAATEFDQWAKADAMPPEEEITRIRRLITRIKASLDELTTAERDQVEQAVAVVRQHRAVMLGMPRIRQLQPSLRPGRTA
jgi:hypothetical protein